jgi:hypothetical protein
MKMGYAIKCFMLKRAGKIESSGKIQSMSCFELNKRISVLQEKFFFSTEQARIGLLITNVNGWVPEEVKKAHWIKSSELFSF